MFATRTLARAPVAGRLAGSVSTLRVASLSAFTSGSKLAGFFGRASGQSGAPAFQQLGLRMSLCRAFSSQPPIQKLTEAEKVDLCMSYTFENFKSDYEGLIKDSKNLVSPQLHEVEGKKLYHQNSILAVVLLMLCLGHQRSYLPIDATRDYRLQLLKEQGLEAYFDEVKGLIPVFQTIGNLAHDELMKELGLSIDIFFDSLEQYSSTDMEFLNALHTIQQRFPKRNPKWDRTIGKPKPLSEDEFFTLTIGYVKECKKEPKDVNFRDFARRIYAGDRLFQETNNTIEGAEAKLDGKSESVKKKIAEYAAAIKQDFD